MEHRALSWLKREYRHDVFCLIATSGVNSRVFFFRKDAELKSEPESESEQDEDSVSSANLVSLVNDLLKIDFESFFLEVAKLNRSFRDKYPVPQPIFVSLKKARIDGQFRFFLFSHNVPKVTSGNTFDTC